MGRKSKKNKGQWNRYHKRIHRDREQLQRDERKARGEKNDAEAAVDDVLRKVLGPDHPTFHPGP